jgi:eukaryotic-like serine/threonine-protein kinase
MRFGRYLIISELGRGAFGVVFLASDTVLGRKVALKVPRPLVLETPEVRRRFVREAEAASRLDHPHIVPVYDVGEEGPICYIAAAYCDGLTLAECGCIFA